MWRDPTEPPSELAAARLTYPDVGATRADSLPGDYHHAWYDESLGAGPEAFDRAVTALFGWRMHAHAGLSATSSGDAAPGVDVILRAGWGPLHLTIPCRVVYTIDEPGRRGFAYGTLPGHPVRGEEAFMVVKAEAGDVRIQIRAFSRPASLLARAGGPVSRAAQRYATGRYITALRRLAQGGAGPEPATS